MQVEQENARTFNRHESKATALLTRENDAMRTVIQGHVEDVSAGGFSLLLPIDLTVGENLLVELENVVQRFKVRCRARVNHVEPKKNGGHRVECSLIHQFTAHEVQLLKSNQTTN